MTDPLATVLVVEDHPPDAKLIQYAIEATRWGAFRVLLVPDLAGARRVLSEERVDAIVADLGLRESTGLATLRAIRDAAPGTPVMVLTGDDDAGLASAALAEGAMDCQAKSRIDSDGIGRALRYAILRRQMELDREAMRQNEAQLARMKEAEQLRHSLVALIAHELRTPMTPLILWLEVAEQAFAAGSAEDHREALIRAKRSSERLRRLIDDVVLAARASRMGLPMRPTLVDLGAIVMNTLDEHAPALAARELRVVPVIEGPLLVEADADKFHSVLQALLSNAVKFSRPGGKVEVRAGRSDGHAILTVRDEGAGISAEAMRNLFQPFGLAEDALRSRGDARGLDLYLARVIVEGHAGRIWAESAGPGHGAAFHVEIPVGGAHHDSPL